MAKDTEALRGALKDIARAVFIDVATRAYCSEKDGADSQEPDFRAIAGDCAELFVNSYVENITAGFTTPLTPDTIGSHFGNGGGFDPESGDAPVGYWLEPYRTMDAGGSPETAGQVGHSWLIDIARQEHENDPAALEIDLPRLTEDGTAQILYRGPKVVAAYFIVRDPLNFAILFRYLAHPPHPAPVDPVAGGEDLREVAAKYADMGIDERAEAMADNCDGDPWELIGYFREKLRQSQARVDAANNAATGFAKKLAALKGPAA